MNEPTTKEEAIQLMLDIARNFNVQNKEYMQTRNDNGGNDNNKTVTTIFIMDDKDFLSGKYSAYKNLLNIPSYLINKSYYYEYSTPGGSTKYLNTDINTLISQSNKTNLQYNTTNDLTITLKSGYTMDRVPFKWYPLTTSSNIKNTTVNKNLTNVSRLITHANTQSHYSTDHVYIYVNSTFNFIPAMKI